MAVEILERSGDLGGVEFGHMFVEESANGEQRLDVAAHRVLHNEEHMLLCLQTDTDERLDEQCASFTPKVTQPTEI